MRQRHSDTIVARSVSHSVKHDDHQHSYASLHSHHLHRTHGSVNGTTQRSHSFRNSVVHTSQLSLFVVFDKKAIVIRVADSAVDEIELWEDPTMREMGSPSSFRMSTSSTFDGPSKDQRGPWAPFSHLEIPIANQSLSNGPTPPPKEQFVGFLTRGKRTQIVHHPLRLPLAPPFRIVSWSSPPTHVIPRVLSTDMGEPSVLQLTAIGLDGVEVQELNLPFILGSSKGKGKAASEEPIRVLADVGDAGLLCHGGRWHEHGRPPRAARKYSDDSFDSSITRPRTKTHCGVYAWSKKGTDDWRVFWLGGSGEA